MFVPLLFAGALLATNAAVAQDQVYKWVDANGDVTYSSTPPPGKAAQPVDLLPSPSDTEIEAARERERSLQELGDQLSQQRADREAQAAEERKARAEAAAQQPAPPLAADPGYEGDAWWIPTDPAYGPGVAPPGNRPGWPVRPPPPRDPTQPADNPAYWPREPVVPPGRPLPPRPMPMPLR